MIRFTEPSVETPDNGLGAYVSRVQYDTNGGEIIPDSREFAARHPSGGWEWSRDGGFLFQDRTSAWLWLGGFLFGKDQSMRAVQDA